MKLNVKTLKGSQFEIRVQPTDTVMAVKKNIEDSQGKDNYPCGQQLLIHNGKVLKDESTLAENKVIDDGFVVVMLSKTRSFSSSDASSTQVLVDMFEQLGFRPRPKFHPNPAPDAAAAAAQELNHSETYVQAASSLVAGSNLEQTIQQIMDMGGGSWDQETVARALRAAYNNPERAVDYLYTGIPEAAEIAIPVASFPSNGARLEGGDTGAAAATSVSGRPNSSPLNLFPQEVSTGSGVGEPGPLDFLRNSQQFQTLRSMVQENPHILQPMLQEVGKQNPELLGLIQEHQAEFLQLINDPLEDSEGDISDQVDEEMPHAINVTPAEQEAIRRLEAMGFDRVQVLEAFFACDRNEELAVNYLLEHAGDSED